MDPTVVHHDNRTGPRELVHLVQEAANESFELLRIVGTFDSIQSGDSVDCQRWENQVPTMM